jgi:hypothetical protein
MNEPAHGATTTNNTMASSPPPPPPDESDKSRNDKSINDDDDGDKALIVLPRVSEQSSSLLLAALDLASFSAATVRAQQQPPLPLLKRQDHYRPVGAFAIIQRPPLDAASTLETSVATSTSTTTSSTTAVGSVFRVPVADLVVEMRDIEIAEIYAGRPLFSANSTTAATIATSDTSTNIRIHHSVESVPFPLVRSEKYNGLCSSRFFYALSCLVLLLILMVAIVYAMDVLQDNGSR